MTIVELPEFIRRSKKLLAEDELSDLIKYLPLIGKSEKANLSQAERNQLAKLTHILVESYGEEQ